MWGNALGWWISALIVLVTASLIGWVQWSAQVVTQRTEFGRDSNHGAAIALPVPPKNVLPSMTESADAGDLYRQALEIMSKDPGAYLNFSRTGKAVDIETIPATNTALQATRCASANLFRSNPTLIVNLNNEKPQLEQLQLLGKCMVRAALLIEKEKPAEAMALYEATFALGDKLYQERLTYAELDAGLSLMAQGSTSIARLSEANGNTTRAKAVQAFDQARKIYVTEQILPMVRILLSADQPTIDQHFGDVLHFVRHADERMWRVEAIFALARYRFDAARIGDQNTANQTLRDIAANESDPIVRAAAIAGRDLTTEGYRMLK